LPSRAKTHHAQAAVLAPLEICIRPISHAGFAGETKDTVRVIPRVLWQVCSFTFFPIIIIENREVWSVRSDLALSSLSLLLKSTSHQI